LAEFEAVATLPEERRTLYAQLPVQRDELIDFVNFEAHDYLDVSPKFCHCDLSHAHYFVSQASGVWKLSGVIDWAEAMLGPPEWDITFLWLWTFSGDHGAMKACLQTYFAGAPPPDRFARRCFAAVLHNVFWVETWRMLRDRFAREHRESGSLVRQMTEFLFPGDVFGPPD
jgi:aminoglycoside phosphotransferase (APT) family kinase protein